ncbi:hypothetical protein QWY28_11715 [Nocardioides sp. SOB77]|uniref:Sigma-70 family RNA polymerase sigma factor n=1 Tax=Nocardioides oceani TaxID=3058369 RepID=A0ABT8FFZ5_9ACTN|nr:hypothetical protein [Nocardioides oceani]MDN4173616.1 hypothetical protein [Nocardioides oceani]
MTEVEIRPVQDRIRGAGRGFAHESVHDASDVALTHRARAGEAYAAEELLGRHGPAVRELADDLGPEVYDRSYDAVRERLSRGEHLGLPVRTAWLAEVAGTTLALGVADHRDAIWSAYRDLADAWQIVLWHHAVEGETADEIGAHLGLGEPEVARAVASARIALRQATAARHTAGTGVACQELLLALQHGSPVRLDRSSRRGLREHGRHCDDCMALVRDVFLLELSLRETLAEAVLGEHAAAYLRTRPEPRRLPVQRSRGAAGQAAARRLRPVVATAGAGIIGAAAAGVMLVGPYAVPSRDGDRVAVGNAALPGSVLMPVRVSDAATAGTTGGSGEAAAAARAARLDALFPVAPGGTAAGPSTGSGAPGQQPGGGAPPSGGPSTPGEPSTPTGPNTPTTPTTPATPSVPSTPSTPGPAPTPIVDAGASQNPDGSVTVGVQTPVTGPVEVTTPPLPGGSSGPVGEVVGDVVETVDQVVGGATGAVGGVLGGVLGGPKNGTPVTGGGLLP